MQKEQQKKDKFNPNQALAVYTTDRDILVSAGAGCGKTFVMIERIAENIINKAVSVDELLVVTYTNAAASEMRVKLNNKINELLAGDGLNDEDKNYLRRQADLIGQSDICTLHKFCQNIIQKYFFVIDLDSSFAIAEESETEILRNRAIAEVCDELLSAGDPDFLLLANTFDDKRGYDKINEYVFKIFEFLNNQPDIDLFIQKVNSAYDADLNNNRFAQEIDRYTVEFFEHYVGVFSALKREAMLEGLERLVELLDTYIQTLSKINIKNGFEANHHLVYNAIDLHALPRNTISPEDDAMKTRISEIKSGFSKGLKSVRENYITPDIAELKRDMLASQGVVNAMFKLVALFRQRFLALKKEKNLLDFSDLEHFAYEILKNPQVGEEIRRKYKQIYVDEYQDVNDIQEGILNLIHKQRDIFLVGDVKQSIYGFRNTNPQIFLDKLSSFGREDNDNAMTIHLNENYRSDQRVLDYVNMVFGILMTQDFAGIDYLPDNGMRSGANYLPVENALPIVEVMIIGKQREETEKMEPAGVYRMSTAPLIEDIEKSYAKAEAYAVYNKIMELMSTQKQIYDAKKKCYRDIQFGDITLLARTRSAGLVEILNELTALGLPVAPVSRESIMKEYEVRLLFDYLNLIDNRRDDIRLAGFLVSPIIGLDEDEMSRIRMQNPKLDTFCDCVLAYENDDEIKRKIDYALDLIDAGRERLVEGSVYETLLDFCEKTGYLHIVAAFDEGESRYRNVMGFVNSFIGKKYNYDLYDYLATVAENRSEQDLAREPNAEASVIGFATMHQSKGLEYPIVFMVDCGHNYNNEDKRGDFLLNSDLGVGMYTYDSVLRTKKKTILHSAVRVATKNKDLAERERLLYVAMTRAKNHLYITGAINLDKFESHTTAYALKSVQNDMSLILSSVNSEDLDTLKNVGTVTHDLGANNKIVYHYLPATHTGSGENAPETIEMVGSCERDDALTSRLRENQEYKYPHLADTTISRQNSVTSLNRLAGVRVSEVIKSAEADAATDCDAETAAVDTEVGIAFHKAMQYIDFSLDTEAEVAEFLGKILDARELKMVDCGKILRAIQTLSPIIGSALILREQPFIMRAPICDLIKSEAKTSVLVDGVVDLIAVKDDEIIIIDYKTSHTRDLQKTANSYRTQLDCYQKAVQGVYNRPVIHKFLYFFLQERLILIDNN